MIEQLKYPLITLPSGEHVFDMPQHNLYDTLVFTANRLPEKIGITDSKRAITYAELLREVDLFADYLHESCHIHLGKRVALLMVNSIEFCIAFYAVLKLGATVVSINTKLSTSEITYIINDSTPVCVISDPQWISKVDSNCSSIESVVLSAPSSELNYPTISHAIDTVVPKYFCASNDADLPALIMYTSGTTGKSKGAVMTHRNLLQGLYSYAYADNMDDTASTVLSIPVFHITGLNCVLTLFIFLGASLILCPFFDAKETLDKMTKYKVNYIHAVATVFILLTEALDDSHNLSSLRTALCGGGFISREVIRAFCQKAPNCVFHPVYGMTETSGAGTYTLGHCLDSEKIDTCGQVALNCSIKIVSPSGNELPANENGEICFKGPFIINSYLRSDVNENIVDGWLHSGDIGCFDSEGYLFIHDRIKDMINRGGEKIFSLEIENAIISFGNIAQAAVFPTDDLLYGEVPSAVIVPSHDAQIDIGDLTLYLKSRIAHYKVPVYIELRTSLPITASGKIKKYELRKEFNEKYALEGCKFIT